ncbi:hypothetical protein OCEANICA350_10171 [Oceanicaulis sp. 350]|nr:hypothetical protein OCEANICA350_10171 [Oceanicaulis sp. 350]
MKIRPRAQIFKAHRFLDDAGGLTPAAGAKSQNDWRSGDAPNQDAPLPG